MERGLYEKLVEYGVSPQLRTFKKIYLILYFQTFCTTIEVSELIK